VALHETSDGRLKANVTQLTDVLDRVDKIRGVSFEWNEMSEVVGACPGERQIGVIAQEVDAVFPELVSTPEDGYKSVDYAKLTPVLIEAVKELKSQNEALQRRIEALETAVQGNQALGLKEI
jgi:hypothetical protein